MIKIFLDTGILCAATTFSYWSLIKKDASVYYDMKKFLDEEIKKHGPFTIFLVMSEL